MLKKRVALILAMMLVFTSVIPGFAESVHLRIEGKDDVIFNQDVDWDGDPSVHDILVEALGEDYDYTDSQYGPNPNGFKGSQKMVPHIGAYTTRKTVM
ncbi:hypothetical protein [Fusibacter sp. JL216-2]|uniref:hypothetical protein n=1 Tax=Fusibacter sp. JL216-2 TaxID=3071453 RepID=UPI003D349A80